MPQDLTKGDSYPGRHHIRPRSRGGKGNKNNIYPRERWGEEYGAKHFAWNTITGGGDLFPEEFVDILRYYTDDEGNLNEKFFSVTFFIDVLYIDGARREVVREERDRSKRKQRKAAWHLFFSDDMNVANAIKWIKREFINKDWFPGLIAREAEARAARREEGLKKSKKRSKES